MDAPARQRLLDVLLVLVLGPVAVLLAAAGALAVLLCDGRPVFFRQARCGRHGRTFTLLKLRTMQSRPGPEITAGGDDRITRCGSFLRALKLDELPQLWNVLVGDMALVGPRPEVPAWVARHRDAFAVTHQVRPGITAVSSIRYRNEADVLAALVGSGAAVSVDDAYDRLLLPAKLELERRYVAVRSVRTDLLVLLATAWAVLLRRTPEHLLERLLEPAPRPGLGASA